MVILVLHLLHLARRAALCLKEIIDSLSLKRSTSFSTTHLQILIIAHSGGSTIGLGLGSLFVNSI